MHLHPSSRGSIPALGALAPPPEAADPDRERSVGRLSSYLRPPQDSVGISSSRGILAPLVVRGDTRPCPADPSPSSSSKAAAAVMLVSPLKDRPKPVSTMPIEIPNRKPIIDTQISSNELGSAIENFYPYLSPDSVAAHLDGRKGGSLLARLEEERFRVHQRQQPLPPDARARLLDAAASMDLESVADSLLREAEQREREHVNPYLSLADSPSKKEPLDDLPHVAVARRLACHEEALRMRDRTVRAANTGGPPRPLSPKPSSVYSRRTAQSTVRRMSSVDSANVASTAAPPLSQPFRERSYTDPMPTRAASKEVPPPVRKSDDVTRFVSNYLSDLLSDHSDVSEDGMLDGSGGRVRGASDSHIDVKPGQARPRLLPLIRKEDQALEPVPSRCDNAQLCLVGSGAIMSKPSLPMLPPSADVRCGIDEKVMELLAQAAQGTRRKARGSMSPPSSSDHSTKDWSTSLSSGLSYDSSLLAIDLPAIACASDDALEDQCTSPLTTDRSGSAASRQTIPEDLDVVLLGDAPRSSPRVPRGTAACHISLVSGSFGDLGANMRIATPVMTQNGY